MTNSVPVLEVNDLAVSYQTRAGGVTAVRDVSFQIMPGQTFGLVGESGCGKSSVAYSIVNSLGRNGRITAGQILFQGRDLVGRSPEDLRSLRGNDIAMVFQDPLRALNPALRVGEQLSEALIAHQNLSQAAAYGQCIEMLRRVHMPDPAAVMRRYPHQISGGQQQRVVIAMSLLNHPALLIMDEPTTALDVTVEAAVLDLIGELRQDFNTAILYISHNLNVVARVCKTVGVMYAGTLVENAAVTDLYARPRHPYTQALLRAVPRLGYHKASHSLYPIPGRVPPPDRLPPGCLFEPRCAFAQDICRAERPALRQIAPRHFGRCHLAEDVARLDSAPALPDVLSAAPATPALSAPGSIIEVEQLRTYYRQSQPTLSHLLGLTPRQYVKAVDGVSFQVPRGSTLGIVGESGCGKSTLARTIVGLEAATSGKLDFMGVDLTMPVTQRHFDLVKELQMVFQNPDSTLNPSFSVGFQLARSLKRLRGIESSQVRAEVITLLSAVRLDASYYDRLPRQLSGGEKQRVAVARAIASQPDLVICDEPVSALDVSVQAAILNLLLDLQNSSGITVLFISHDLSVVRFMSDYVAVMYLGQIVEFGAAEQIYAPPYHPYTEALLAAIPTPDPTAAANSIRLTGNVPSALNPPAGCRFHTRCPRRARLPGNGQICAEVAPPLRDAGGGHIMYCHLPLEQLQALEPVLKTVTAG